LVKFPVALSGGSKANCAPVEGAILSMYLRPKGTAHKSPAPSAG
jgi:hypothetical protein